MIVIGLVSGIGSAFLSVGVGLIFGFSLPMLALFYILGGAAGFLASFFVSPPKAMPSALQAASNT